MKIGWVGGADETFANAVGARLAEQDASVRFERLTFGAPTAEPTSFAAVLDGASSRVPFFRSMLLLWAESGIPIVNDPRALGASDRASAFGRLARAGLPVPQFRILPNKRFDERVPPGAFRHLEYPWPFAADLAALGGRAYLTALCPNVPLAPTFVESESELLDIFDRTGFDLTMLTEVVPFDRCVRVFVVGGRDALWARFDPTYASYLVDPAYLGPALEERVVRLAVEASRILGLDLNAVDVAIDGNRLVLIDPFRPQPDLSAATMSPYYFNKLVPAVAELLLLRAGGETAESESSESSESSEAATPSDAAPSQPPSKPRESPIEVRLPEPSASVVVKVGDVARALARGARPGARQVPGTTRERGALEAGQE